MGAPAQPALGVELTNSFCRTDPEIARHFARVAFLSDNRAYLHHQYEKELLQARRRTEELLAQQQIRPVPDVSSSVDAGLITGIGSVGERMLILTDVEALMVSPELGLFN